MKLAYATPLLLILIGHTLGQDATKKGKFGPKEAKQLIADQPKIKEKMKEYIKLEEKRLNEIRQLIDEDIVTTPKDGFANPLAIFRIIKQCVRGPIFEKMQETPADFVLKNFTLPDYWDMEKAGTSVLKMMERKKLSPKEVADQAPDEPLTYDECFQLGRMAYNTQDYYNAAVWMEETWKRMQPFDKKLTIEDKIPVLDFWSYSLYQEGNVQRTWWMTKQILEMDPKNKRFEENLPYYEKEMKTQKLKFPKSEKDLPIVKYKSKDEKKSKSKKKKEL